MTPEEREADQAAYDRAVESGLRPQDQIYVGAMPNGEGFEAVPWKARPEMARKGIGKYCPSHLHQFTDKELTPQHYPKAWKNELGEPLRFCWACGRPCQKNGVTGKGHKGSGKPCPACGFRRKREIGERQMSGLKPAQPGEVVAWRNKTPEELAARQMVKRGTSVTDMMRERALARGEAILDPYFKSLELAPKEEWSPSTKLEFYMNQTMVAERLLNRVDGMPMSRMRHVTKDDEDVLAENELSPGVLVQLVAAIATGANIDELLADAEDAEFEEVQDGDDRSTGE